MSDSQLEKLINRRTRLVEKHTEFDRRLGLMKSRGRLVSCAAKITQLKRWKLRFKDSIATIDARIDALRKATEQSESAAKQPKTPSAKDLSAARVLDVTAPEERDAGVTFGKAPPQRASAAA